jgi:hypothetical protein
MKLHWWNTPVSAALHDLLVASTGTAWDAWHVLHSTESRLELWRYLPMAGDTVRQMRLVIIVDRLGRVQAWSAWESKRLVLQHTRAGLAEALEARG